MIALATLNATLERASTRPPLPQVPHGATAMRRWRLPGVARNTAPVTTSAAAVTPSTAAPAMREAGTAPSLTSPIEAGGSFCGSFGG